MTMTENPDYYGKMIGLLPGQFRMEAYETHRICEFICDTVEDIKSLPEDCEMGSTARIVSPPAIYRKMSTGRWVLQRTSEKSEVKTDGV